MGMRFQSQVTTAIFMEPTEDDIETYAKIVRDRNKSLESRNLAKHHILNKTNKIRPSDPSLLIT